MGYDSADAFRAALTRVLENCAGPLCPAVRKRAGSDRRRRAIWSSPAWRKIPETLKTLAAMGFGDAAACLRPPSAAGIMAASAPCARQRARELLTKLMPAILKALAGAADPDAAFTQFDRFLSSLPSGRAAVLAVPGAAAIPGAAGQDRGLGAAAGQLSGAQSGHAGCAAGCGFSRAGCRRAPSWMPAWPAS